MEENHRIHSFTRRVERYLRDNGPLRAAVGADEHAVLQPRYIGVGEHNLNYSFVNPGSGEGYVLRVNVASQPFHDNQVAYEFGALQALASSGCTPKPVYLDDSPDAPGKGAIVESFCAGRQLDFDNLKPGELECAVQLMADVHAVPVGESCPLYRPADPLRELFAECCQRFEAYRASAYEDARVTRWVERFLQALAKPLEATTCRAADCARIVNTETLPSHFLIPDRAAQAAAANRAGRGRFCEAPGHFIDWERPIVGEAAQDVAYFVAPTTTFWDSEWMCPTSDAERIVNDYWRAVDGRFDSGSFEERFPLYRAMTALRSATWCCRALVQYSQAGTHKTEKTMRKLPVYLSDDFMHYIAEECFAF